MNAMAAKHSSSPRGFGAGMAASKWAVKAPAQVNPQPDRFISGPPRTGSLQPSTPNLRYPPSAAPQAQGTVYTPPHLRKPESSNTAPVNTSASQHSFHQRTAPTMGSAQKAAPQAVAPHLRGAGFNPPHLRGSSSAMPTQCVRVEPVAQPIAANPAESGTSSDDAADKAAFLAWLRQKQINDNKAAEAWTDGHQYSRVISTMQVQPAQPPPAALERVPEVVPAKPAEVPTNSIDSRLPSQKTDDEQQDAFKKYMESGARWQPPQPVFTGKAPAPAPLHNMSTRLNNPYKDSPFRLNEQNNASFATYLQNGANTQKGGKRYVQTNAETVLQMGGQAIGEPNTQNGLNITQPTHNQYAQATAPSMAPVEDLPSPGYVSNNVPQNASPAIVVSNGVYQSQTLQQGSEFNKPWALADKSTNSMQTMKPASPFGQKDPHAVFSPADIGKRALDTHVGPSHSPPIAGPGTSNVDAGVASANIVPSNTLLTQDALFHTTGFKTVNVNESSTSAQVSNTGVDSQEHTQDLRATRGNDASTQLLDWDKKNWAPVPCNWETERGTFDDSFVPDFIQFWRRSVPAGASCMVNTQDERFYLGHSISNIDFSQPIEHPDCIPDVENSIDENKRLFQTAYVDSNNEMFKKEKRRNKERAALEANQARAQEIAARPEEPNPFAPTIDIYLRPADDKDAADLAVIYNHYILKSNIPEDQEKIGTEDALWLIQNARETKLPFIVAVKGREPSFSDAQGRPGASKKAMLPVVEQVVGFAYPERFNYGITAKSTGRSRCTLNLQLYVHPEYTRKGVGRNLLDRLIHCLTSAYAYKNGAPWINPNNDSIQEANGGGMYHQVQFQVPVEKLNDPDIEWVSKFLRKFWFKKEATLPSVGRSTIQGHFVKFLDLVILQSEIKNELEFESHD